jgi:hypothetical protein
MWQRMPCLRKGLRLLLWNPRRSHLPLEDQHQAGAGKPEEADR